MAIKETLKEKGDANLKKELKKYIKEYSLDDVSDPEDLSEILALAEEYVKTDIQTGGASLLPGTNTSKPYLKFLIAQNWFIMRKLSEIAASLSKNDLTDE
ncbi:MAG: hypothetical protein IJM62_02055 [Lachnospiraceae bacterium]|nr:hypothetical protein [Lachnospiraceae bacterium]